MIGGFKSEWDRDLDVFGDFLAGALRLALWTLLQIALLAILSDIWETKLTEKFAAQSMTANSTSFTGFTLIGFGLVMLGYLIKSNKCEHEKFDAEHKKNVEHFKRLEAAITRGFAAVDSKVDDVFGKLTLDKGVHAKLAQLLAEDNLYEKVASPSQLHFATGAQSGKKM